MFDYTVNHGQISGIAENPIIPHPDGKAWPKCCKDGFRPYGGLVSCAFVRNQDGGARLSQKSANKGYLGSGLRDSRVRDTPFMCVHRSTDDGYYRVCAGWDAVFGNKAITAKSVR